MNEVEHKLQELNELAKKISSSDILNKEDINAMDKKVSSVLKQIASTEKQYFKRLA